MSLVSLTFGNKNANYNSDYTHIGIQRPMDDVKIDPAVECKLEIKKTAQFFKDDRICIIGEIVSGVVAEGMKGSTNGDQFDVLELECKYPGAKIAKKGMTVCLMTKGAGLEKFKKGEVISFSTN